MKGISGHIYDDLCLYLDNDKMHCAIRKTWCPVSTYDYDPRMMRLSHEPVRPCHIDLPCLGESDHSYKYQHGKEVRECMAETWVIGWTLKEALQYWELRNKRVLENRIRAEFNLVGLRAYARYRVFCESDQIEKEMIKE